MTKVNKNNTSNNLQTHIKEAFAIIDEHLPERYVPLVVEKLKTVGIDAKPGTIRRVKFEGAENCNNLPILNALLLVAKDNEKNKKALINTLIGTDGNSNS